MAVTLKQWEKAVQLVDKRARDYMKRRRVDYPTALTKVLSRDAKLRKVYQQSPTKPLTALKELAAYLNAAADHPSPEAAVLLQIMRGLKCYGATKAAKEMARAMLEFELSNFSLRCVPLLVKGQLRLGLIHPPGFLGTIAAAAHDGRLSALHCCRWCEHFFVEADHRKTYCSEKCSKARATHRVKVWRHAQDQKKEE
jgi:hypothetical protein